jgi:hypothetical protein
MENMVHLRKLHQSTMLDIPILDSCAYVVVKGDVALFHQDEAFILWYAYFQVFNQYSLLKRRRPCCLIRSKPAYDGDYIRDYTNESTTPLASMKDLMDFHVYSTYM